MEIKDVVQYLVLAALSGSGALISTMIFKMCENLKQISNSVQELNARISILTTQMIQTNDILKDHETRIRIVERVK